MSEVLRTATAHPLVTTIRDSSGFVAGNTVLQSVYDPAQDQWLDMGTGAWTGTKDTAAKTETETGVFLRNVDVSNANGASQVLLAIAEVTAGPAVGMVDVEPLVLRATIEPPTAAQNAAQADAVLSGTHGAGNWESAGGLTEQSIWEYILTANDSHLVAGGAAEALFGAGGGFSPTQVADEIMSRLVADYENDDGTVGQVLYNLDSTSLRLLLEAALGKMTRFGYAYLSWPVQEFYVDDVGEILRRPILLNGELADLTGASISWRFVNISDASVVTRTGTVSGTPGHAEYETEAGDGITDQAGDWRAYATATLPGGEVRTSERMRVRVQAVS
jgi:hypothetical protein